MKTATEPFAAYGGSETPLKSKPRAAKGAWAAEGVRCKEMTMPVWWRREPAPCKLPAWKDGYCRKHHPARRAERRDVSKELAMCRETLKTAEERVARVKVKIATLEAEERHWLAFISGAGGWYGDAATDRKSPNARISDGEPTP